MKADALRNLRLVMATTLLSVWGYSHLAQTPWLGDTVGPLVLALVVAPGVSWRSARTARFLLVALVAFLALTAVLYWQGSSGTLQAFTHDPWFVVPVWLLALFGLVRNAISAERSAALARAASAAAHAPDAG
jgi:hypothetical protein